VTNELSSSRNTVCFTNLWINLLAPSPVTSEKHSIVLELLDLLRCMVACLQLQLTGVMERHTAILQCF